MQNYLDLCRYVLENGTKREDRTGTGTISTFGYQMRCDLEKGFPLLTTKKVYFKAVLGELLWIISGSTNIRPLVLQNIRIWNEWPYEAYKKSQDYQGETMDEFIQKIKEDEEFALKYGDLGPVYGKQWRDSYGVDQLLEVEKSIKENPFSRRHIICAWNPSQIDQMALPPCHAFVQFYVSGDGKKLSCQLYQRSADLFLGVPFNIASYATLLIMMAHVTGLEPGEFIHTFGDVHIYLNLVDQVKTQLERTPRPLPQLKIKRKVDSILDFKFDDFELVGYDPYPKIEGKVSV
ncbi:MAG: thymidylate synthase [Bacilli bacterium]|nr:thymidylate synthase [Bacillales bacterium]MDY2574411.1 thymidylate synthase [Bacilli bacterium]